MRKWLGVLLLGALIYLASTKFRLSNILYVSSCHFAYENDEYKVTALILDSNNENEIISSHSKDVGSAFTMLGEASSLVINFRHMQSIIFDFSILNEKHITNINSYFLNNSAIDFNFYVFVSDESSKDLFSYQNPKSVDNYYSVLNVNDKTDSQFSYIKPCHLITFLKKWSDNALVKMPIVGLSEVYNNKNIMVKGVVCLTKEKYDVLLEHDEPYLYLLNNFKDGVLNLSEYHAILNSNKIKIRYKDKLIVKICLKYEGLLNLDNKDEIKSFLLSKIKSLINYFKQNDIDYLNIKEINKLRSKNYTLNDIMIDLELQKK